MSQECSSATSSCTTNILNFLPGLPQACSLVGRVAASPFTERNTTLTLCTYKRGAYTPINEVRAIDPRRFGPRTAASGLEPFCDPALGSFPSKARTLGRSSPVACHLILLAQSTQIGERKPLGKRDEFTTTIFHLSHSLIFPPAALFSLSRTCGLPLMLLHLSERQDRH